MRTDQLAEADPTQKKTKVAIFNPFWGEVLAHLLERVCLTRATTSQHGLLRQPRDLSVAVSQLLLLRLDLINKTNEKCENIYPLGEG